MKRKSQTIIIIDDDPDDYELAAGLFRDWDSAIQTIHLGSLADWQAFITDDAAPPPRLVLMDYFLPVITGPELIGELKQHARLRYVPVVVWSATVSKDVIQASYDAGATSVIQKPAGYDALTRTIGALCTYWFDTASLP